MSNQKIELTSRTTAKASAIRIMLNKVMSMNQQRANEGLSPIINLTVGQPHLPPHTTVIEKLGKEVSSGAMSFDYSHSAGREEVLLAILRLYQHYFPEVGYDLTNVMCSVGASFCLFLAFAMLVEKKEQAIGVFPPYFSTYRGQVELLGGSLVTLPIIKHSLRPDIAALDAYLNETPNLKAIILNYPCNPTGIVLTHAELQALAEVLKKYPRVILILDDVYRDLNFGKHETLLDVDPTLKDRTLVIHSTAKGLLGAPDMRGGFMAGPAYIISAMIGFQQLAIASPSYITQRAIGVAISEFLENPRNIWQEESRQEYESNVRRAQDILENFGFTCIKPEGAFYLFAQATHLMRQPISESLRERYQLEMPRINTDLDLANYFLKVAGVAIVPGSGFGMDESDGYFRISCAAKRETLEKAMYALGESGRALLSIPTVQASVGSTPFWESSPRGASLPLLRARM
jgi:aspartate aminotransferase